MSHRTVLVICASALESTKKACSAGSAQKDLLLEYRETASTAEMSAWISEESASFDALIVEPAGDISAAVESFAQSGKPLIEIHRNNEFQHSDTVPLHNKDLPLGFIAGLGDHGFTLAVDMLADKLAD